MEQKSAETMSQNVTANQVHLLPEKDVCPKYEQQLLNIQKYIQYTNLHGKPPLTMQRTLSELSHNEQNTFQNVVQEMDQLLNRTKDAFGYELQRKTLDIPFDPSAEIVDFCPTELWSIVDKNGQNVTGIDYLTKEQAALFLMKIIGQSQFPYWNQWLHILKTKYSSPYFSTVPAHK